MRSRLKQLILEKEVVRGDRITGSEIASKTGLDENTISRWMSPRPLANISSKAVVALCAYLECGIGDLLVIEQQAERETA